jgi:HK97 family phage major capsid protein
MAYKLTGGWENGNSVSWLTNRSTEGVIRSIASSSVFSFAPNPAGGMSPKSMLWGWPMFTSGHMPAATAGNKSVVLANWRATVNDN